MALAFARVANDDRATIRSPAVTGTENRMMLTSSGENGYSKTVTRKDKRIEDSGQKVDMNEVI